MRNILKLGDLVGCNSPMQLSLEKAKENLHQAKQNCYKKKPKAVILRITFLENKATSIAEDTGQDKRNIYKQLIRREAQRHTARKIRYLTKDKLTSGITKVDYIDSNGHQETYSTKEGIEQICMQEKFKKFQQTNQTPCM